MDIDKKAEEEEISLGKTIQFFREKSGLNLTNLAKKAALDIRLLDAIEKSRIKHPGVDKLSKICGALNISLSDLFGNAEASLKTNVYIGRPQGEMAMNYLTKGYKIISFAPLRKEMFCGKIILPSKSEFSKKNLENNVLIFAEVIIGKINLTVENQEFALKEGTTALFDGKLRFSFRNAVHKEASFLFFTSPNFLSHQFSAKR